MSCSCFHTTATAITMASAGPIWNEHTPEGCIAALHEAANTLHRAMCLAPCRNCRRFCYILLHHSCRKKYLQGYFSKLIKSLQLYSRLTPLEEVIRIQLTVSIDTMPLEGQTAPPWWWCLWDCCWGLLYFLYYSYCSNSTAREIFVPARTHSS